MSPVTLLYVEDEEDDVIFMRRAVRQAGAALSMQAVGDGRAAINYLSGKEPYSDRTKFPLPTIILLDLNLPLVSGFEVLRWLREQPNVKHLPVLIFSSSGRAEDREMARTLGANNYLMKPASGVEFCKVLNQVVERWLTRVGAPAAFPVIRHGCL